MKQDEFNEGSVPGRKISNFNLLMISFAAIFGSGWLFAPLYAAQLAGPAAVLAWCFGAAMAAIIGITMAEVIVMFPKNGGLNQIALITHGKALSLLVTVFNLLVFVVLPTLEVRAVLQYSANYFPTLMGLEGQISWLGYTVSVVLLSVITLVNLYGSQLMTLLNNVMVGFKVITPILVCVSFFYVVSSSPGGVPNRFSDLFPIPWEGVFQAIATSGIIFSFNGFNQAIVFAGEARHPQKAIPFAILGSLFFSGVLYILLQITFVLSVPQESLAQGWAHLSFVGDQGPFAGIASLLGLHWIVSLIYSDAVVSPMGTAFTYASSAPRLISQLSSDLQIFPAFSRLNRHGVSISAVVLILFLEVITFFLLPTLKAMISILVAAFVLCYTIAPASLLVLRKTHSSQLRPFRVLYAPVTCFLSLFFSNLMVFSCGWGALKNLMIAAAIIVFGFLSASRARWSDFMIGLRGAVWFLFQLISLVGICYLHEFEGLSFLLSSTAIAYMSGVSLVIAQRMTAPLNVESAKVELLSKSY